MNPIGATTSQISSAADGQQVGSATIGGISVAGYWSNSGGSFVSLAPSTFTNISVTDTEAGLQVGTLDGKATLWRGTPGSAIDLHALVPAGYSASRAEGIDVAADGTVTIVGQGLNQTLLRWEAMSWQGTVDLLTQDTTQISASAGAVFHLYVNGDPQWANRVYAIVGSANGSVPGILIGNNQLLPLNPDFYLDYMVTTPNDWIVPSLGYLDSSGRAAATATLPAGAIYVAGQVFLNHAVVILTANGSGFEVISDAVPLVIVF